MSTWHADGADERAAVSAALAARRHARARARGADPDREARAIAAPRPWQLRLAMRLETRLEAQGLLLLCLGALAMVTGLALLGSAPVVAITALVAGCAALATGWEAATHDDAGRAGRRGR
ncbi:MAG: hypothetical protein ACJ74O_18840 [Frankiaceae bacterium]